MWHMNMQTVVGLAGLGVSFALMYPTLLAKLSLSLASPYAKAESRRRLYAATIDGLLVASIFALYWSSPSIAFLAMGAACILLRDAVCGRSLGKFLLGLTVVSLETGRPGSARDSVSRNVIFLLPGANVAAVFLEARTLSRDQQGLRLGDRLAMTQVVDGYGAKDLALDIQALLENLATQLGVSTGRRRRRAPARVDRAA
jgi:RDD family